GTRIARRRTRLRLRRIRIPLRVGRPPGPASLFPLQDRPPAHLAGAAPHAGYGCEFEQATDAFAVSGLPTRRGLARGQASLPSGPASDLCRARFPRSQAPSRPVRRHDATSARMPAPVDRTGSATRDGASAPALSTKNEAGEAASL